MSAAKITIAPGVSLWPQWFDKAAQTLLLAEIEARVERAPFFRSTMPRSGKPMSVEMTNFGSLGWLSDKDGGYRYQAAHPATGAPWPDIPQCLLRVWDELALYRAPPEACLVNLYRQGARMGLHQDADEKAADAPVLSVSLGDDARFRIGGDTRGGATRALTLHSGDVLIFGGPARMAFHGIDRIVPGTSRLVPGGGRLNLTLRRVTRP